MGQEEEEEEEEEEEKERFLTFLLFSNLSVSEMGENTTHITFFPRNECCSEQRSALSLKGNQVWRQGRGKRGGTTNCRRYFFLGWVDRLCPSDTVVRISKAKPDPPTHPLVRPNDALRLYFSLFFFVERNSPNIGK